MTDEQLQIEYDDVPEPYLPMIQAMTSQIVNGLRLAAAWESINIRVSPKLQSDGRIWVQWELHHALIAVRQDLLQLEHELYRVLMHEFAHMVTWPWMEAIDQEVSHIADRKKRGSMKRRLVKQYERVNNELARSLLLLIPWKGMRADEGTQGSPTSL